jgi:hypothetical protein
VSGVFREEPPMYSWYSPGMSSQSFWATLKTDRLKGFSVSVTILVSPEADDTGIHPSQKIRKIPVPRAVTKTGQTYMNLRRSPRRDSRGVPSTERAAPPDARVSSPIRGGQTPPPFLE